MLLLFVGLIATLGMHVPETAAAPDAPSIVIVPIGDSNTVGFTDGNPSEKFASYRYWLHEDLTTLVPDKISGFVFKGSQATGYDTNLYNSASWKNKVNKGDVKFIGWNSQTTESMNDCPDNPDEMIGTPPANWCVEDGLDAAGLNSTDHVIALVHLGTNDVARKINGSTDTEGWGDTSRKALKGILEKLDDENVESMTVLLAKILPGDSQTEKPKINGLKDARVNDFNDGLENEFCNPVQTASDPLPRCTGGNIPDTDPTFKVYLVDMNTGFDYGEIDKTNDTGNDFQDDDIHLINTANKGEDKMAQRWFAAIEAVVGNGGPEPPTTGVLTIKKVVVGQQPGADWEFEIDNQTITIAPGGGEASRTLDVDTYTITETAVANYTTTWNCGGGEQNGRVATVILTTAGATCTFTNTYDPVPQQTGTLTIKKVVIGQQPGSDWEFKVDGQTIPIGPGGGEASRTLNVGDYTITETAVPNYTTTWNCGGVEENGRVATVNLTTSGATCTFTNTYTNGGTVPEPDPDKENIPKADGESIAYRTSNTESNRNSSFNQADVLSITPQGAAAAIQGAISPAGDVDFFKLEINNPGTLEPGGGLLFDVDADNGGSDLDAELCVYDGNRNLIGCNDDADGHDPMLYVPNCGAADSYYVEVRGYGGASTGDYVLSIDAELVIVSPERGGRVDGLRFDAEDILARTSITGPVQYKWIKFFDASDLGIYKNIIAFDLLNSCPDYGVDLAVTFTGKQRITDSTGRTWKSTPYDVVSIDVSQFGPVSSGEFDSQLVLEGSEVGLTSRGERIDAITYMNGTLLVSMVGGANLPDGSGGTIQVQDEDLAYLVSGAPQPAWAVWFDGSTVPGLAPENLYAASFDSYFGRADEVLYYLIQGKGRVNGYPASQRTLCVYEGPGYAYCQGSQVAPFNIDALD